MKRTLIAGVFALVLPLGGCSLWSAVISTDADTAATATMNAFLSACVAERDALAAADAYDQIHPFTPDIVAKINAADVVAEGICPPRGAVPTNVLDGVNKVLQATIDIAASYKGVK